MKLAQMSLCYHGEVIVFANRQIVMAFRHEYSLFTGLRRLHERTMLMQIWTVSY